MADFTFTYRTLLHHEQQAVFDWHTREGAFNRLTPPWEPVTLERFDGLHDGARAVIRIQNGPIAMRWVAEHHSVERPSLFCDRQLSGPFASWEHQHRFLTGEDDGGEAGKAGSMVMEDHITYRPPGWVLAGVADTLAVRTKLERMFAYRHRTLERDLDQHARFAQMPRQTVLIAGASGMIGQPLAAFLSTGGHTVRTLTRDAKRADASAGVFHWNPGAGEIDHAALEGVDAVINLAGSPMKPKRLSAAGKDLLEQSRLRATRTMVNAIAEVCPGVTLLNASGLGYYGPNAADVSGGGPDEASPGGDTFLALLAQKWEAEALRAEETGSRVALLRMGAVLSPKGGALGSMASAFAFGLGGKPGSGAHTIGWVSVDDCVYAIGHALMDERVQGGVNVVSPVRTSWAELTAALGKVMRRPALWRVPAGIVRAAAGEMADEVLLASTSAKPSRLAAAGFTFTTPAITPALAHLLGNNALASQSG